MEDKFKKNNIEISQAEISALKKLVMYVKFSCEEEESLIFAGSESINSFFDKIIDVDYLGEHEKFFYSKRNKHNEDFISKKIEKQQEQTPNKIAPDLMQEYFDSCLYPFKKG